MNNINYNQNYNIYNKNNGIFNINYNKNHNIYITIIIFLILILLIIIKITIFRIQIIIFIILIIILNLFGQSFYSNFFLKLLTINHNNNNNNNNDNCYYFFQFSFLQGLQTQSHGFPIPRRSAEPRGRSKETLAGGSADPLAWGLQSYHAPPNEFVILHCGVCRSRGASLQPGT
jgi:hypothetical protein